MGAKLVNIVDDLWSIFNCNTCGVLFFFEPDVQNHIEKEHAGVDKFDYGDMEFIRAIPQKPITEES